jgi:competence ComEA-like helix-hairpin-helix protein/phasin family protein
MAKLNVNTASREELVDVAGLKPALADSILKYREESGKIADLDALRDVPRITSQVIDQLRDTVDFATEAVKETTEKAAEAAATMAKAGAESTRKIGEKTLEVGSALTRGGTEATQRVVSSFVSTENAAAERSTAAASELSGLVVSLLKEQMQANVETLQAMARVRNWSDAIELQNEFFRGNVERMTQGASRYVETMTRLLTSVASVGSEEAKKAA